LLLDEINRNNNQKQYCKKKELPFKLRIYIIESNESILSILREVI